MHGSQAKISPCDSPGHDPPPRPCFLLAAYGADLGHGGLADALGLGGIVEVMAGGYCGLRDEQELGFLHG